MENWKDKRVLVIGAARQGLALTRYLSSHGARVVLNDQRSSEELANAVRSLQGVPVEWALGGHPLPLLDGIDLVCASGGVPLSLPLVAEARRRNLPLSNNSQVFMEAVTCPVVGITGSAGKTTTTTLVGRMAAATNNNDRCAAQYRKTWVGGNIGMPLISVVDQIKPEDLVVMELSSFQLELMDRTPWVAAVLNVTPNHLDRHGSMEAYTAAKERILAFQKPHDWTVLGREDPVAWSFRHKVRGNLASFGLLPPSSSEDATFVQNETVWLQHAGVRSAVMPCISILLRGEHNLLNVTAACATAHVVGLPATAMQAGIEGFTGVPHRLQMVRTWHGADWYNDSIATAPERSMASIRSFEEPIVLMLGGRDKNLPWGELADLVHKRVDHVVVFGEARDKIVRAIASSSDHDRPYTIEQCSTLHTAVEKAAGIVQPGDVVLLAPGGTSFDEFRDFEERGEWFEKWVKELS